MKYLYKTMLATLGVLCFSMTSFAQSLQMDLSNVAFKEAVNKIQKETGYTIIYENQDVDPKREVSISMNNGSIDEAIKKLIAGQEGLLYEIQGRNVILKRVLMGNTRGHCKGHVVDANGQPVISATVKEFGSTNGVATDLEGNFDIEVRENALLEISFVGYEKAEVRASLNGEMKVTLQEDREVLDAVVVVGYGTQLKKNLSSSIAKVNKEDLDNTAAPSFESLLQGRAAGISVTTGSAMGGSTVSIRVRGTSSLSASSEPLYVIDGVPMEGGSISARNIGAEIGDYSLQTSVNTNVLASINPNDIESLEILKDAAAAAIYGSRGANGVVLITTKKGRQGKVNISASANWSVSTATHKPKLLNSQQYLELAQEAWTNSGNSLDTFWEKSGVLVDGLTKEQALATNTDWVDETLQTGFDQDYNVSLTGGSEKLLYYISGNVKDQNTIIKGNHYQKFSTRANLESQLSRVFRIGANMFYAYTNDDQAPVSWDGGVGKVTFMLPIWPVYKDDGSYFKVSGDHPVASVKERKIQLTNHQFIGNWFLKANIAKGLTFRTDAGLQWLNNSDYHFKKGELNWHKRSVAGTNIGRRISWNWNNVLNYSRIFGKHNLDVVLAHEMQKTSYEASALIGEGFFNSAMTMPADADVKKMANSTYEYTFLSFVGRVNYSFRDTYLLSLSLRADASSRFAPNNRWGYFPAVSLGYTMSNEKFFEPLSDVVNFLKIRASYGVVGNAEIGNYAFHNTFKTNTYNGQTGIIYQNIGDPSLGWEETTQLDLGLDLEFLKGRIGLTLDWYDKRTSDLLLPYPVSSLTGVTSVVRNVGEVKNTGFELALNTQNIKTRNFSWDTSFNLAYNKNEVTDLNTDKYLGSSGFSTSVHVGYPLGAKFRAEWGGVDPATGEDIYIDKNGKSLLYSETIAEYGSFTNFANANGKVCGNPCPEFTGGFTNKFTYKNLSFSFMWTFATGQDFDMGILRRSLSPFGNQKYNAYTDLLGRWQKPGDHAKVSKLTTDGVEWSETTETLHRTDYLRLKDVTLSYNIPIKKKGFVKNLNCYIKGVNLVTFTKAPDSYWDPEWAASSIVTEQANFDATAPQALSVIMGVKIDF